MEDTDDTPLMKQYRSIKNEYTNAVLFFRLGDFYEMFDDDAKEISRLLNLTLTHRGSKPMCGIPFHAAKIYIARLLRAGKRIAICEQVGEVTGKGLTERRVVEVITPGTAVDGSYLDGGANNFLACLCVSQKKAGFAFIDITTADFFATSWNEDEMNTAFSRELARSRPREILLPESLKKNETVQAQLREFGGISVSFFPDWDFDKTRAFKRLTEQFGTKNLKSFSLKEDSAEITPAGFLLEYIARTTVTNSPHVSEIRVYRDFNFLMIDESSRRNLEITSNLRDGSIQFSLLGIFGNSKTAMGKRLVRKWLLYPLLDVDEIRSRQNCVERFVEDRTLLAFVRENLSNVLDLERLAGRIAMERAHAKDLQALRSSLESWILVANRLGNFDLNDAQKIATLIEKSILDDPSTSFTEGRLIREGWSKELDDLRDIQENAGRILADYAQEEREKTGILGLKIKRTDTTGYFIEIPRGKIAKTIPEHFVLRRALANSDRFTTTRLQEIENAINDAFSRIVELEKNLFLEVRSKIAKKVPYLLKTAHEIAFADCTSTFADVAQRRHWIRPIVDNSSLIEIKAGRHPVVESQIPDGEFVPNDTILDSSNENEKPLFCLITGPNMAGKSTYLRQSALIVLLAQIGSFVPAQSAKIGIVDKIFCRVGASDNLAKGESTFLVEMSESAFILRNATKKSLVIMDEVGRGTSTQDGLSIAWAVCEYLLNFLKCKTLFATHYHELTQINHKSLKLLCLEVLDEGEKIVFLRKIKEGASENSYGIHVASLAGVPKSVIFRAEEILAGLQGDKKTEEKKSPALFSTEELVSNEIRSLDLDEISPKAAFALIERWQNELLGE